MNVYMVRSMTCMNTVKTVLWSAGFALLWHVAYAAYYCMSYRDQKVDESNAYKIRKQVACNSLISSFVVAVCIVATAPGLRMGRVCAVACLLSLTMIYWHAFYMIGVHRHENKDVYKLYERLPDSTKELNDYYRKYRNIQMYGGTLPSILLFTCWLVSCLYT